MTTGLELRVQGARFSAWTKVSVSVSIETACRSFSVEAIRQAGEPTSPIPLDGDCEIWLAGARVMTGVVGRVQSQRSGDTHRIEVQGRSKTREIVDCTADHVGRWTGRTLRQIAADLCGPYGVEVVDLTGDTTPMTFALASRTETVYAALERAARVRGALLTDDADGRLVLTRAGARSAGVIERGRNILSSSVSGDIEQRFSEIRCHGQRAGSDGDFGSSLFASASASDDGPRRRRLLIVESQGRADAAACLARARWEAATRYGKSISIAYDVPGWTRDDGALWTPNVLTRVVDPAEGIAGSFLLVSVTFRQESESFRSSLELAPREGFEELVLPTLKTRGRKDTGGFDIQDADTVLDTVRRAALGTWAGSSGRRAR